MSGPGRELSRGLDLGQIFTHIFIAASFTIVKMSING